MNASNHRNGSSGGSLAPHTTVLARSEFGVWWWYDEGEERQYFVTNATALPKLGQSPNRLTALALTIVIAVRKRTCARHALFVPDGLLK